MTHERLTAAMQFTLTVIFLVGYFVIVGVVLLGRATLPVEQIRIAELLLVALTTILPQVISYWFARQRSAVAQQEPPP